MFLILVCVGYFGVLVLQCAGLVFSVFFVFCFGLVKLTDFGYLGFTCT